MADVHGLTDSIRYMTTSSVKANGDIAVCVPGTLVYA
jgi:hypothetical protein